MEYPFPATDRPGRDKIAILDIGPDGHATKFTTFAESLNIPIGLYPYKDGCIAHSIPEIHRYFDDNGDDHADRSVRLYGDIGHNDTHGMTNDFRRGFDGWLYANHGFNNISTITALDGSSIILNSGNTYRIHVDGSHIEQFTWGQTNPFGSCSIRWGIFILPTATVSRFISSFAAGITRGSTSRMMGWVSRRRSCITITARPRSPRRSFMPQNNSPRSGGGICSSAMS